MTSLKHRFTTLDSKRRSHLNRQRDCARLTIPALLPPESYNENHDLPTPWQSLGARGVNNLASKLLTAMLPPNGSFFRLVVAGKAEDELEQQAQNAQTKLQKALGKIERKVSKHMERLNLRVPLFRAIKLLITTGNALCYVPDDGGMQVYRLDNYVVTRDSVGNVVEIITRESVAPVTLPDHVLQLIAGTYEDDKDVEIFTRILRRSNSWSVTQEINGVTVPEAEGSYPFDKCPWIALRWSDSDGGSYGRGLCDENLGDLESLESLTKTIVEGSAAAAKVLFLVDPNGVTNYKALAETENTGFAPGKAEDVTVLQLNKFADFQTASQTRQELIERLSMAFLMHSSVQRNAERVTAEEIRFMASELESALGGVYSLLSQEFQLPLVKRVMHIMKGTGDIPELPEGTVDPVIITGLDALGRGNDLQKLQAFLSHIQVFGPETLVKYLVIGDYIERVATSLGMDTEGLARNEEEVMNMEQYQMFQAMLAKIGPDAMNQLLGGMMSMAENEQTSSIQQGAM